MVQKTLWILLRPRYNKSWRTLKTLFNNPKVYWRLQLVGSRRKKERETETTMLESKKKRYIMVRKSEQTQTLNFFPCSNMLVHMIASRLRPPLERTPKTFVSLHFRSWCSTVCLYLIMFHRQLPKTKMSRPLPSACLVGDRNISVSGEFTHAQVSNPQVFSSHF